MKSRPCSNSTARRTERSAPWHLVTAFLFSIALLHSAEAKKKATKLDDLPRHTYAVSGSAVPIVESAQLFEPFAAKVRADIEAILLEYEIEDRATLKGLKGTLLALELLAGREAVARALIREIRELEDKPAAKILTGLSAESRFEAARSVGDPKQKDAEFRETYRRLYQERLAALPWDVVQADLKELKGGLEIRSRNLYVGLIREQIDPAIQKTGTVGRDTAEGLIAMRAALEITLPLKDESIAALAAIIDAHRVKKADIWAGRSVTLDSDAEGKPVVIAVWDSGVDTPVFGDRVWRNPREDLNAKDDDANGFIDDLHGIAYDLESDKTPDLLFPVDQARERLPKMKSQIKGLLDLQAAIDSEEATALKRHMSGIEPDQVKPFIEDLNLFSSYAHGTHVAGIATEGNPFARILSARLTFDHRLIPICPTLELARKEARMYGEVVDYFKQNGVRVVNMSWGGSLKDIEGALEANGVEQDAEKRSQLARQIFAIGRDALREAIAGAPGILFVCAAGNSDNDVEFDEMIPSGFRLPNMITVGAVDQAGDRTSFTSFGKNVEVYANGFEVDSTIPGGDRMPFSGTSMASPNVANLAAKLFALNSKLSVADVIRLIKENTEKHEREGFALIHPKKTVEQFRQARAK